MKILITGANGFIGRSLVKRLVLAGHEIDVLARTDLGYFKGINIRRFHSCDITVPFTIAENFDAVIHLAAYNITHVGDADSLNYLRMNVEGTVHVLSGVKTDRFIFLSTAKLYEKHEGMITEDSLTAPKQAYEKSKQQAEEWCRRHRPNGGLVILRLVNVFGPGQPEKAVIPIFFSKAIKGEPIKVFGPRGAWLQFIYIDDLVNAIEQIAVASRVEGVFNVAAPEMIRLEDLALMVKKICHSSSEISYTDNSSDIPSQVSYDKIKKEIGWQPSVTLEEGLSCYYKYYVQHCSI